MSSGWVVVCVGVAVGCEMSGVTLGEGPLKGVGDAEGFVVGVAAIVVGVGVAISLATNHIHVEGLNSVVCVLMGAA